METGDFYSSVMSAEKDVLAALERTVERERQAAIASSHDFKKMVTAFAADMSAFFSALARRAAAGQYGHVREMLYAPDGLMYMAALALVVTVLWNAF